MNTLYRFRCGAALLGAMLVLTFAVGCDESVGCEPVDVDGDGFFVGCETLPEDRDCDDSDPSVSPDALEVCDDGFDNDCDGDSDFDDADCLAIPE